MLIRPARPGLGLRDPVTRQLIPEDSPIEVPANDIWNRRVSCGLVVVVPGEPAPVAAEPEPEPAPKKVRRTRTKKAAKGRAKES